jgi:putative sterol carrier protein
MKFLTEEWSKEFIALAKDTFSPEKTPSKVTVTLCECYNKVPQCGGDTVWFMYTFKDGVLTDVERGTDRANAPAADYVSDADYDICVKNISGELSSAKALTSGKIKLKGNLMKGLKLLDTHNILAQCKKLNGKTEW